MSSSKYSSIGYDNIWTWDIWGLEDEPVEYNAVVGSTNTVASETPVEQNVPRKSGLQNKEAPLKFLITDSDVETDENRFNPVVLHIDKVKQYLVDNSIVMIKATWGDALSEVERLMELRNISTKLFARPETFFLPAARIAFRVNNNEKALASLSGKPNIDVAIEDIRDDIVEEYGEQEWEEMIKRESERRALDIWKYNSETNHE